MEQQGAGSSVRTVRATAAGCLAGMVVLAGCAGSGGDALGAGDDYSVAAALAELPAAAVDGEYMVLTGDLDAATDALGLERPEDAGDIVAWLGPLTGLPSADGEPSPVFVPLAEVFSPQRVAQADEIEAELGWSVLDATAFVESSQPPDRFAVVAGEFDDDTLPPDLPEVSDGVVTAGEGGDHQADLEGATAARPTGMPLRLAQDGGLIAASPVTHLVEEWAGGDADPFADESATAVAAALDEADAYAAVLVGGRSFAGTAGGRADVLPQDPFDAVGIGWAVEDGDARITLAYSFADEAAAEAALPLFEEQYRSGLTDQGQALGELLELLETSTDGAVAVVTVAPAGDRPASTVFQMLHRGDVPFQHR